MNTLLTHTADGMPEHNNVAQVLTTTDGRMVAYGQMSHNEAQRLAACWNKFQGFSTESIESMPGTIAELVSAYISTRLERKNFDKVIENIEAAAQDDDAWAAFRQQVIDSTDEPTGPLH